MKKIKINRLNYSIYLSIFLSLTTFVFSILSPEFGLRLVYNLINFFLINIIFLISVGILAEYFSKKEKDKYFFFITTLYFMGYILSSISFLNTKKIIGLQTVLFLIKINSFYMNLIYVSSGIILLALISKGLEKTIELKESKKSKEKTAQKAIIFSLILILSFNYFIYSQSNIEDQIVKSYKNGRTILIDVKEMQTEEIMNVTNNFENFNVVFILLESVSTERISYYGYQRNVTPNIDWFAQKGITFTNAYATATHSDYAQPAYLSSNHILENNYRNMFSKQKNQNAAWQIFNREGYKTYYFSSQDDSWAGMQNYFNYTSLDEYWFSLTDNSADYESVLMGKKDYDETTTNKAIKTLNESESNKPFFLYLNFQATHEPLSYPEEYVFFNNATDKNEDKINKYDNALRYVDIQVGKLKEYLEETGELNKTIIVISSDHGHDLYSKHGTYGHGLSIYDDEIKVPLIFYLPKEKPQVINNRVGTINVLPTVLKIMDIKEPEGFRGSPIKGNQRIFFYTQTHRYLVGMIEEDIKVIIDLNKNLIEVYNLKNDPEEKNNLYEIENHDSEILTLLMWHNCQLNYFSKEEKQEELEKYCKVFERS